MTIPESVRNLISTGPLAHVTTLNSDGSPQVTVVWVGIEDDEIVSGLLHLHHKLKNIHRDPRVAVSLQSLSKNAIGLQEYLVIYGDARVTEGGAVPLLQRLARIYMGPDADFPPAELRDRPGFVTRMRAAGKAFRLHGLRGLLGIVRAITGRRAS
jgi:PPOX class probable F420-dependent enzyme